MESQSIFLQPSNRPQPRSAYIPKGCAIRWRVPVEDGQITPGVSIFVSQRAFVRFCAHAGSDLDNEVGGWLVGKWCVDKRTAEEFIVVESILNAPFVHHGGTFLTFTQDSQVALYEEMQERYPGRELIGWYHTHPRMGIFLSQYDTWLHEHFFPESYQVALVIEPHSSTGGFFIRQPDGSLDPRRFFGFYELTNRSQRSVVYWRNVYPEMEIDQGE